MLATTNDGVIPAIQKGVIPIIDNGETGAEGRGATASGSAPRVAADRHAPYRAAARHLLPRRGAAPVRHARPA